MFLIIAISLLCANFANGGILYPKNSETREVVTLDGIWRFAVANKSAQNQGFEEKWFTQPLHKCADVIDMPVPSSYNDITQDASIRDHIGWVWYQKEFFIPKRWKSSRVNVRFGSANYMSIVWVNGVEVVQHSGGYLPFEAEISQHLKFGHLNHITVAINNTLTPWTIPQGRIVYHNDSSRYPPGYYEQQYNFDFTNYAGIHRPVLLYTTPISFVDDVSVITIVDEAGTGFVYYKIQMDGPSPDDYSVVVEIYDADEKIVSQSKEWKAEIQIAEPHLWWPRGMNRTTAYLYTLKVQLWDKKRNVQVDVYRLPFGIRMVQWNDEGVFVNGEKVYFKGFGRHEDAILRGRGLDLVTLTKDYNLMRWIGANCFRTSHYPYSEELMDLADQQGFMVINEVPAVGLDNFDDQLLLAHTQTLKELIARDKNRPSVVMWSVGNEPQSQKPNSAAYFNQIASFVRRSDPTRPVTLVINKSSVQDVAAQFMDVICINRYFGWYSDTGHSQLITFQMVREVTSWHDKHHKPVIVTEYGAGSIAGLKMDPPVVWTEDYQVELMEQNFEAFDQLRAAGYLVGEMIWNFADFATPQGVNRVVINRKGLFTRERQPKEAARLLKRRYTQNV